MVHRFIGLSVDGFMGSKVHGLMGVHGFMGGRSMVQAFWVTEQVQEDHWSFDPMIQNIILPQIGAMQGDHCVLETPYMETTVLLMP